MRDEPSDTPVLLLIGALPNWPYRGGWGYYSPSRAVRNGVKNLELTFGPRYRRTNTNQNNRTTLC